MPSARGQRWGTSHPFSTTSIRRILREYTRNLKVFQGMTHNRGRGYPRDHEACHPFGLASARMLCVPRIYEDLASGRKDDRSGITDLFEGAATWQYARGLEMDRPV